MDVETAEHLLKIGRYLSNSCPPASRFYMYNLERSHLGDPNLLKNYSKSTQQFCQHCGSIWSIKNSKVQIKKRPAFNCRLKRLFHLDRNQPWKLNFSHKKELIKFRGSTSKLVYNCWSCGKKTVEKNPGNKQCNKISWTPWMCSSKSYMNPVKGKRKITLNAGLFIPSSCNTDTTERI